jgi:hypothetical protein
MPRLLPRVEDRDLDKYQTRGERHNDGHYGGRYRDSNVNIRFRPLAHRSSGAKRDRGAEGQAPLVAGRLSVGSLKE